MDQPDLYCGEPALAACEDCLRRNGSRVHGVTSVETLRAASAGFLASARVVVAPSDDMVQRMLRYAPLARIARAAWEPAPNRTAPHLQRRADGVVRVAVPGAIGFHKGYNALLACAQDAIARDLPLEFVVVGYTQDDGPLLRTGRIRVTGQFSEDDAEALLASQRADVALFASPWPETWSYTLSETLRAGLPIVALDTGAVGERLRQAAHPSLLLPPGTDPAAINDALLALARRAAQNGPEKPHRA